MRALITLPLLTLLVACQGAPAPEAAPPAASTPAKPEAPKAPEGPQPTPLPADAHPALTDPSLAAEQAPETFSCRFETSKGEFVVAVTRAWAPLGADRFYNLCRVGYWDEARFFRNVPNFMVQFGVSAYPEATKAWQEATIMDDPVVKSNTPLMVTFAKTGKPNSRSTQVFINHKDNSNLDDMGFAPFGKVTEGADVVAQLYNGYGEGAPRGRGPDQGVLSRYGEVYLADRFPLLDKVIRTTVE
ncbi:MAG: peptidylprolyl isomerase [Alphaproteobacteria bacterium]|nr:peptidylprolyl isomerase [Alphaproteobacteria bacterium]